MKIILLILLVCQLNVIKEDVLLVVARGDDDSFTGNIFAYINNNNIYIYKSIYPSCYHVVPDHGGPQEFGWVMGLTYAASMNFQP